jgi:hypothetical protein
MREMRLEIFGTGRRAKVRVRSRIVTGDAARGAGCGGTINGMGDPQSSRGQFSLGGTLGAGAGTAFRWLRGKPGPQKLLGGVRAGVSGFVKPLMSVLRVLFLELSGVMFLFFSLSVAVAFVREYKKYAMHEVGWERLALAGAVGAMFLYFGVSSFWQARRKRSRM